MRIEKKDEREKKQVRSRRRSEETTYPALEEREWELVLWRSYRRRRVANGHVLAEGYMDKTLVSIPFPNTALAMYLLIGFP